MKKVKLFQATSSYIAEHDFNKWVDTRLKTHTVNIESIDTKLAMAASGSIASTTVVLQVIYTESQKL